MANEQKADRATSSTPAQAASTASATTAGGSEGQSAGAPPTAPPGLSHRQRIEFNALRSAYGHEDRELHYSFWHRVVMFVVAFSGTAAFSSAIPQLSGPDPKFVLLVVAVFGLIDLVFDLTGKAREHGRQRYRFLEVYAEAQVATEATDAALDLKLHRLYADEPPQPQIIDVVAYNRAMRTMERPTKEMLDIPWGHRCLRHFFSRTSYDYKRVSERRT